MARRRVGTEEQARRDARKVGSTARYPSTHEIGAAGEKIACDYLEGLGLEIYDRNWRCPYGEADIIAIDGSLVVLVEVKTRRLVAPTDPTIPEIAVDAAKRYRYQRIAGAFMVAHPDVRQVRFDVVSVGLIEGQEPQIRYLVDAYGWDD